MIWLPVYKMEEDGRSQSTSSDARHDYPNASAKTKGCIDIKLTVDRFYLASLLKALLHSIIFHRGFAITKPVEVTVESLDITYAKVDDPETSRLIDDRVAGFIHTLDNSSSSPTGVSAIAAAASGFANPFSTFSSSSSSSSSSSRRSHVISVLFSERRRKKNNYWFSTVEEDICWERWNIHVTVTHARNEREQIDARRAAVLCLSNSLLEVTKQADESKDNVPPITSMDESYPFPFQIV